MEQTNKFIKPPKRSIKLTTTVKEDTSKRDDSKEPSNARLNDSKGKHEKSRHNTKISHKKVAMSDKEANGKRVVSDKEVNGKRVVSDKEVNDKRVVSDKEASSRRAVGDKVSREGNTGTDRISKRNENQSSKEPSSKGAPRESQSTKGASRESQSSKGPSSKGASRESQSSKGPSSKGAPREIKPVDPTPIKRKMENLEPAKKGYKRSDSKYQKEKIEYTRSNPKFEYSLDDADSNEKELILKGTLSDRLTSLALLCARNPSEQNYKQLLQFCENQRNDVIYNTLKLLRDLIKEKPVASLYIKGRIIKSFEMGSKNQYIKDKVVEIIGVLIRADIYSEDFVNILVSRLLEKGKTLVLVENALKSVFPIHESLLFQGVEDFYFKNDDFRCQHNVLKFLQDLEIRNKKEFFNFYDQALTNLDEYPKDQKDLMIELLVNGLSKTISENDRVTSIDLIRYYIKSSRSIISSLNLLIKTKDPYTEAYVLKVSRTTLLRNTKHEPEFLNMIYKLDNRDLFAKLIDNSFYYSVQSILSFMLIAYSKRIETHSMFSLRLLSTHYNPIVRDISSKMLRNERIQEFDPFDKVYIDGLSKVLDSK